MVVLVPTGQGEDNDQKIERQYFFRRGLFGDSLWHRATAERSVRRRARLEVPAIFCHRRNTLGYWALCPCARYSRNYLAPYTHPHHRVVFFVPQPTLDNTPQTLLQ